MTPQVEALESLRAPARDSGSSSHRPSRLANRHGYHSRLRRVSAAVETGCNRYDAATESRNDKNDQQQSGHAEQHEHRTSECRSEASGLKAVSNQLYIFFS